MELLLDTHAWVWSLWDDPQLSPAAREAIGRANVVRVSPISFFEIGQKVRIGKWPEMAPYLDGLADRLREQGGQVAPLTAEIALLASQYDWAHRDPFDRLIAATAVTLDAVLISADTMFDTLDVPNLHRIWS